MGGTTSDRAKVIKFPRVPIRCEPERGRDGYSAIVIILPVVRVENYSEFTRPPNGDAA